MTFRAESVMIRRRISMASRRSHARHLELRTRQLIPDTADDDDPVRAPGLTVDADDVTGMKSVETGRTLARDQQRVTAREVTARVAIGADPDRSTALVHTDDGEAILLKPVGKALRHCETPFQLAADTNATVAKCYVWSDQIVNIARPSAPPYIGAAAPVGAAAPGTRVPSGSLIWGLIFCPRSLA